MYSIKVIFNEKCILKFRFENILNRALKICNFEIIKNHDV